MANTFLPSLSLMPLMWSGWKCEISDGKSIASGLTPAAASAPGMWPVVGPSWPPVPASISTSFDPVFTSVAVNEVGTMPGCRNESAQRLVDLVGAGVAHELVVDLAEPGAVVERGHLVAADLLAIDAGALHAGGGRRRRRAGAADSPAAAVEPASMLRRVNAVMAILPGVAAYRREHMLRGVYSNPVAKISPAARTCAADRRDRRPRGRRSGSASPGTRPSGPTARPRTRCRGRSTADGSTAPGGRRWPG